MHTMFVFQILTFLWQVSIAGAYYSYYNGNTAVHNLNMCLCLQSFGHHVVTYGSTFRTLAQVVYFFHIRLVLLMSGLRRWRVVGGRISLSLPMLTLSMSMHLSLYLSPSLPSCAHCARCNNCNNQHTVTIATHEGEAPIPTMPHT